MALDASSLRGFGGEGPPDPNAFINAGAYAGNPLSGSPLNDPYAQAYGNAYTQSPGFNAPIQPGTPGAANPMIGPSASGAPDPSAAGGGGGMNVNSVLDPAQLAGLAPQPFSAFGSIPYQAPATYASSGFSPTGYDPAQMSATGYSATPYTPTNWNPLNVNLPSNAFLDPAQNQQFLNQNMGLLQTEMNPIFNQQRQGLDESLAARGLFSSGGAVQAQNDLSRQQDSALAGAQVPLVAQGYGYQQQDVANNAGLNAQQTFQNALTGNQAGQFNAAQGTAAAANNAGATNAASQFGATAQNAASAQNQSALNAGGQFNATAANQAGAFGAGAANQAGATNAASTNAMNQYNANNYLSILQNDQNARNAFLQSLYGGASSYGQGALGTYLNTFSPANSQALGTLGGYPGLAMPYGQQAYQQGIAGAGPIGSAFQNIFSGIARNSAGGGSTSPFTPSLNDQLAINDYSTGTGPGSAPGP